MQPRTYSLIQRKGGASKSTLAILLSAEWHRRGRKTLLVDADQGQGTALRWSDIAAENGINAPTTIGVSEGLAQQVPTLAQNFDRVVLDTPGRAARMARAALMVSDVALLPTSPSPADVAALAETIETVREAQEVKPDLRAFIVLARLDPRTALARGIREDLEPFGFPVLESSLGFRVAYQELAATGQSMAEYAPGSTAAKEVDALTSEVEER